MKTKEWEIYNSSGWIQETDPEKLEELFTETLKLSQFTVLDELQYHFQPIGWTKLYLLAESHLALHTFPENHKTYWELSSCSEEKFILFQDIIKPHIE